MGDNMSFIDFIIGFLLGGLLWFSLGFIYANHEPKPKPKKGLGEIVCRELTAPRPISYIQWSTPFTNKLSTYIYCNKYKTEDGKISNLEKASPSTNPTSLIWNKNYIPIKYV